MFDHTKKVYSIRDPFLSPSELGLVEREQADTIRKANLALFVSSVFGSQDVGFYHLDECFLDTFLADGGRLLKNQAGLFLDLKTQAYISAVSQGERSREDVLQDLFPDDMEQRLLDRRPGARQLAPGEADFIQRANNRKKALLDEPMTVDSIRELPLKYPWEEFLRDISGYVSKNFASIVASSVSVDYMYRISKLLIFAGPQNPKSNTLNKLFRIGTDPAIKTASGSKTTAGTNCPRNGDSTSYCYYEHVRSSGTDGATCHRRYCRESSSCRTVRHARL